MRDARSFPMPGISRSPRSSSMANACGWLEAMSAAFRYARILNGFSSLISRRSAISRRMRAIAALSNLKPFRLDAVVQHARAAGGQRLCDRGAAVGRTVAEQAPTPAGPADLGCGCARADCARNENVNCGSRHAGSEPLAVFPFDRDEAADLVPVTALDRGPQSSRSVSNALEAVEDVTIAVDVPFQDLPVVRAGVPRRAGVGEHDTAFEFPGVHVEREAFDTVDAELDRRDPAIEG